MNRQVLSENNSNGRQHQSRRRFSHFPWQRGAAVILLICMLACLAGCKEKNTIYNPLDGIETTEVKDDTGRTVEVPAKIEKIAPSGAVAQMILMTIAPDMMVGLAASPSTAQMKYFPEDMWYLPTFGQFYGKKATLNMESLIAAKPQVTIDLGDRKRLIKLDMAQLQEQTNIPTVYYEATLETLPAAYRSLGKLLGREEKAEELAAFVEKTLAMAEKNAAKIPEDKKLRVLFGTGATGLAVNADGSSHSQVIDLVGARNAIVPDKVNNKDGGTLISLEEVYEQKPDVIIQTNADLIKGMKDGEWADLDAVKNDRYYLIPTEPYSWMSAPPSVNMVIGVWWLGQVLYPDIYNDYDMAEVAKEFYRLFWNYELTDEEAQAFLADSTAKVVR